MKEYTHIDSIILVKILNLRAVVTKLLSNVHKKPGYSAALSVVSFIKSIDVKNGEIFLEMNCKGLVSKTEERDLITNDV